MEKSEIELAGQSNDKNDNAFRQTVDRYHHYAYAVAYRFLGCPEDAEDAVQEVFVRVWKHYSKVDTRKKFSTWLYRVVANTCMDQIKRRKRTKRPQWQSLGHSNPDNIRDQNDMEKAFENQETLRMVQSWIQELAPKQRMVFVLRDLQDLSIEEVSNVLKISIQSVKSNLYYARKFLREKLEKIGG